MEMINKHKRKLLLYLIDLAFFTVVYFASFLASNLPGGANLIEHFPRYLANYAIYVFFITGARYLLHTYSHVWRYVNGRAYLDMVIADALGAGIACIVTMVFEFAYINYWQSLAVVSVSCLVSLFSRFVYQEIHRIDSASEVSRDGSKTDIAIIGAGMIGALLADELLCYKGSKYRPVLFVDSDLSKSGNRVAGLPVYSEGEEALRALEKHNIREVIVAITKLDNEGAKEIFEFYRKAGCKVSIYDFPAHKDGEGSGKRIIREFKIEDLLFRDSLKLVDENTKSFYRGKTIIVTGGGGSIGSELCRQIAACQPKTLIIFDIYENNAYDIQQQLHTIYGNSLDLRVEIGSVRDRKRLDAVFAHYTPDVVFHAAAHKHVPLMEHSNCEAIKNNVFGTYNTADMAEKYGVKKFILISTDKAVNPTNVMGASKRMCEMVIRCRNNSKTTFSAVRFGNVLGSNGSVIPLFNSQIAKGGPITITDKRIVRYFMTIPEASGLVMQAGAMAERGELFVLDMGRPVKIIDLAINMITLSGLKPYEDIDIEEIGLRPGEKLYEELLVKKDEMQRTENELIFIEHEEAISRELVEEKMEILRLAVSENEDDIGSEEITKALKAVVPTFLSPEEINSTAESSDEMQSTVVV